MTRDSLVIQTKNLADEAKSSGFHAEAATLYALAGLAAINRARALFDGSLETIQTELINIEAEMDRRAN